MGEELSPAREFDSIFGFVPSVDGKSDLAGRELVRQTLAELANTFNQCQAALANFVTSWGAVDLTGLPKETLFELQSEQACLRASSTEAQRTLMTAQQSARHFGYVVQ